MSVVAKRLGIAVLFALPAVLLAMMGMREFQDGWNRDQALPIPNYMILGRIVLPADYQRAVARLSHTDPADADNVIAEAEAAIDSGAAPASQIALIEKGLAASPSSARGWLLLAFAARGTNDALARDAAAMGFLLGPTDYWLVKIRLKCALAMWPILKPETRELALALVRQTWEEPKLHFALFSLLTTADGAHLVTRAYQGRPADLLAINHWALGVATGMSGP
jgi:hypothetical protein